MVRPVLNCQHPDSFQFLFLFYFLFSSHFLFLFYSHTITKSQPHELQSHISQVLYNHNYKYCTIKIDSRNKSCTIKKQVFCNHNPETIASTTLPQSRRPPLPPTRRRCPTRTGGGRAPRTAPGGRAPPPRAGEAARSAVSAPARPAGRPTAAPAHSTPPPASSCLEKREKLSEIEIG